MLRPLCLHERVAVFPWWPGSSPGPPAQRSQHIDPPGVSLCVGCLPRTAKWEYGSWWGGPWEAGGGVSPASRGRTAVCLQPRRSAPAMLGAPAAQGACRVLPSLYLWKSLIEMQVIKSNVSRSIHFHCTTTFTSPILSGISAAPLSGFFPCKSRAYSLSSLWAWRRR